MSKILSLFHFAMLIYDIHGSCTYLCSYGGWSTAGILQSTPPVWELQDRKWHLNLSVHKPKCLTLMTPALASWSKKWRHSEVQGPLAGLRWRSHHTLWCTCTAVSESPGHFLISWFAVGLIRGQELRVERQNLWEVVPQWIYQWSAGLLISPSLPLAHKSVYKKRWSMAGVSFFFFYLCSYLAFFILNILCTQ